jgi:hypothetical protein
MRSASSKFLSDSAGRLYLPDIGILHIPSTSMN